MGVAETGFTFHQVDRHIDTGAILYQKRSPIRFQRTFRRTVEVNTAEIGRRVPDALARVVGDYQRYREGRRPSGGTCACCAGIRVSAAQRFPTHPGIESAGGTPSARGKPVAAPSESSYCHP